MRLLYAVVMQTQDRGGGTALQLFWHQTTHSEGSTFSVMLIYFLIDYRTLSDIIDCS